MRWMLPVASCLAWCSVPAAAEPRARPPEFTDEDRAAFFDNAFDALVGDRPTPTTPAAPIGGRPAAQPSETVAWAELIGPDVLETEIKRQASPLGEATRSAAAFRAGGYRDAVDALSMLATLMAVTDEHDGQPRWRDAAAGLRDLFAQGAEAADAPTDAAYAAAEARRRDLADLVRGGRPTTPPPAESVDWSTLATRGALMRRMEVAERDRLGGWSADERSFRRSAEDARHEAQVLALLAEALLRPDAADHDDPDYQAFARALRGAATELATAAEAEDQPAAARAMTGVSRSCVDCHADYRG